jgi:release factor glutamine methyltransferase
LELGKHKLLQEHYPPQYFVGHAYLYGRKFAVDKRVLIPRFDTEVVVEAAIQELHHHLVPRILDIGTGMWSNRHYPGFGVATGNT